MRPLPILVIDVDGTLNSYVSGWTAADDFPDPPNPGAIAALKRYLRFFRVAINSSRFSGVEVPSDRAMKAFRDWIVRHGFPAERVLIGDPTLPSGFLMVLPFKPPAHLSLDDRTWRFEGEWPAPEELRAFEPWSKRRER